MWDLPGLGLEPTSPVLAGGFLTTAPPGKSLWLLFSLPLHLSFDFLFLVHLHPQICIFLLAALGLHCCIQAFSSCGEWGPLFIAVRRLLIAVASLAAERGL